MHEHIPEMIMQHMSILNRTMLVSIVAFCAPVWKRAGSSSIEYL